MRPTAAIRLTSFVAGIALVTGCGTDQDPTMDEGRDGAAAAVTAFTEAVRAGDGPGACAQLAATAQRALERSQGGTNCIDAVARAAQSAPTLPTVDVDDVELTGSEAALSEAAGEPIAALFGAESLRLHREDERWLIG